MTSLKIWILSFIILILSNGVQANSLSELIELAYKNNPNLMAAQSMLEAETSRKTAITTLEDPMFGVSTLDRNMETQYGTITQKIRFPIKYYLEGKAQDNRARSYKSKLEMERLKLQSQIINLYYSIYITQKIIQLTHANMQAVKEFARVAEKKYAAGSSPQSDSMKAHFELTQLELDLLRLTQEEEALQDSMRSLINFQDMKNIDVINLELPLPIFYSDKLIEDNGELLKLVQENSPLIQSEIHLLKEADFRSSLSKWEFAPDFQIQYQQRIGGDPEDSKIYSLGITFPLWFWKKSSEASIASANLRTQEYRTNDITLKLFAKVKDLLGKVKTGHKILKVYETSLIPQAQGAYKSARASYQASKTTFLDLLDSERSLYRVRTGFYQSLKQYVESLSQLEVQLGFRISNLVMNEGK